MPRVKAKVLATKIDEQGRYLAKIQLNAKMPPDGSYLTVKWGSERSLPQNNLYWKYLSWLIEDAGLKDQGHFSAEGLHEDLKAYFLSKKEDVPSTALLNKAEFAEYLMKVDEFVRDFFGVDTSPFWEEYKEFFEG